MLPIVHDTKLHVKLSYSKFFFLFTISFNHMVIEYQWANLTMFQCKTLLSMQMSDGLGMSIDQILCISIIANMYMSVSYHIM